jgi:phosphoribosylanthranilate isomerase
VKPNYFRTRIKFCGLTRAGDVRLASELGVDAVGFVFARQSKRRVEPEEARAMRTALAPFVDSVALFMDNTQDEVREIVRHMRPSLLQFHGSEDDAFCRSFGVAYLKAIPMGGNAPASTMPFRARYPNAAGFLFDSHEPGEDGGSGKVFDWSRIPQDPGKPWLLAGGLNPSNVFEATIATRPWGVDVSSGIELSAGIKDGDLMRKFVDEVRRADCHA